MANTSEYLSQRINAWIETLDPEMLDAYDLPFAINLTDLERQDINPLRSVFNKLYEVAKSLDFRIVFTNLSETVQYASDEYSCNHLMASCNHNQNFIGDLLQKFVAISNQTKNNHNRLQIVLRR